MKSQPHHEREATSPELNGDLVREKRQILTARGFYSAVSIVLGMHTVIIPEENGVLHGEELRHFIHINERILRATKIGDKSALECIDESDRKFAVVFLMTPPELDSVGTKSYRVEMYVKNMTGEISNAREATRAAAGNVVDIRTGQPRES